VTCDFEPDTRDQLRVLGLNDFAQSPSSNIQMITCGGSNAQTIMIGEKAAGMIRPGNA
jgi:hypothetical protein